MTRTSLRPPLPPPLSHEGIFFVSGSNRLSDSIVAAIAATLHTLLPPGNCRAKSDGSIERPMDGSQRRLGSLWRHTALQEGIERSSL